MQQFLSDLVSIPDVQQILDAFFSGCRIAVKILGLDGQVIAASSSYPIFDKLHQEFWRAGEYLPDLNERATRRYERIDSLFIYQRVIPIEGRNIAVLFLGPVLHTPLDEDRFLRLAQEADLDGAASLEAVRGLPVIPAERVESSAELLALVIQRLAEKGLTELRLTTANANAQDRLEKQALAYHALEERIRERTGELEKANKALQESEQRFRIALMDTPVVVFNQDLDLRYTWIYNPQNYADQPIVGKTDADLFPPEDAARLAALKRRVIGAGLLTREEVSMTVGTRTFFYDMTLDPLYSSDGHVVGITCAATDITERKQIEEEMRKRLAESEGIRKIARGLLQKVGLGEVLEIVCSEAMQLTGAKGSAVLLLEDGWLKLTHRAGTPVYNLESLPLEGSLAGRALQTGSHVWVNRKDHERDGATDRWEGYPWTPGLVSMLSVPLKVDNQSIGALNILDKPGDLTEEDIRIINLFADQAAIIIEHVRLQHQAEQLAVLEERQRLARELHDSVTQALYSMTLYTDAARLAFSRKRWDALERNLQEVRNMAREAMYDMRLLVFELRPFMLVKEGLVSALRARLAAVEARTGLRAEVFVEDERRLPIGIEADLYRIAQEGLNNVVKHARASVVKIHLKYSEDVVRLEMMDNGMGFDPENAGQSGGVGLQGIRERAEQLGGILEFESAPEKGTHLTVTIPTG